MLANAGFLENGCSSIVDRQRRSIVVLWLLLGSGAGRWALAEPPAREVELEAIRDQIMVLQSQLNRVRQEATGLRGDLEQTRVALQLQETRLIEAQTARRLAEESLQGVEIELGGLERQLDDLRQDLRDRLTDLYRLGQEGYLRLFLSIRSQDDLLPGIRQVRYLVLRDGELLARYEHARAELSFKQEELAGRHEEVRDWLATESERADQLERLQQRQARLLAQLEREDMALSRQTAVLADKERKLANLVDFLYGRAGTALSGTPVQEFQGVLDWPVEGRVTEAFGTRLDPQYKTRVPHNGIELATGSRSEVRAVFPGKVLFAAPFQGYGLTAVIHHPGRVFTLYAGLQDLRLGQNDMVSLGQVIGLSTEKLYFEIREENRPVDPVDWLR
jgi:septal ring factor EnvC (AmiA/AmiB activator)